MSQLIYLSRSFVEFGAFKPEEIVDFKSRGILLESDYVRPASSESWQPLAEWLIASVPATASDAPTTEVPAAEAPAKKAKATTSKKKSGAKKAA